MISFAEGPLEERVCTARKIGRENSGSEEARKTGETARVGAGVSRCFTLVSASGSPP
jgi:hypothetical protein